MIKKSILCLSAVFTMTNAQAQSCATDEVNSDYRRLYPVIQQYQQQLEKEYQTDMAAKRLTNTVASRTYPYTPSKDSNYAKVYIPLVVHIVHDYGTEYISDNEVYEWVNRMNVTFRKQNSDIASVIAPFKPYVGNPNIEFVLAKKDPTGNPTTGITRRQHYLTTGGDDQAKFDLWAPQRYLNIWLIRRIGRGASAGVVAAYSTFPATAAGFSFYDGIIGGAGFINSNRTYEHEIGHYLNLYHPWNNSNKAVSEDCGDDEVDDTPPTTGHFGSGKAGAPQSGGNCNLDTVLYDTKCATGYYKVYTGVGGANDTADFPDTTNVQNIMDYADCPIMFTHMQVDRMRSALKSSVGNRDNLIKEENLKITGIMTAAGTIAPKFDMKPVADFSIEKVTGISPERSYFLCAGDKQFNFKNQSWRDTISNISWTFSNGATPSTSTNNTVGVKFAEHGWVTVKLTASSNAGDSTVEKKEVYAANPNDKINPNGFYQEFNNAAENDKWPIFNYYKNEFKWELSNVGYYDNSSIVYRGFDYRSGYNALIGAASAYANPQKLSGDYDDFFSRAFDLSSMKTGNCNLNFMYAGMWRINDYALMQDSLEIAYSTDCGSTWTKLTSLTKADLVRGNQAVAFAPLSMDDWSLKSINIPEGARQETVYFRFRYKPFANFNFGDQSVGNNYYIDRINISSFPQGVNTLVGGDNNIVIAPNPTTKDAYVVVRGSMGAQSVVTVTDITGKVVYRTEQVLSSNLSRVEIPASAIEAKGIYIVNIVAGAQTKTEKLVVR